MWTKFDESVNQQTLLALVDEMASLDEIYPELETPGVVREMQSAEVFNIEDRPWDFLVALGCSMLRLYNEKTPENSRIIQRL